MARVRKMSRSAWRESSPLSPSILPLASGKWSGWREEREEIEAREHRAIRAVDRSGGVSERVSALAPSESRGSWLASPSRDVHRDCVRVPTDTSRKKSILIPRHSYS